MKTKGRAIVLAGLLIIGCCTSALALDFTFHYANVQGTNQKVADFLDARGPIVKGDNERFLRLLQNDPVSAFYIRSLRIASEGGDVNESVKLAETIRKASLPVAVVGPCASSCFFLYAGAVMRIVSSSGEVGIHRPYFPPEQFKSLNAEEARDALKAGHDRVHDFLIQHDIPVVIREQMMQTASDDIRWLTPSEIKLIGTHPSYAAELLKARCSDAGRNSESEFMRMIDKAACESRELNREKFNFVDRLVGGKNQSWAEFKRKAGLIGKSRPE